MKRITAVFLLIFISLSILTGCNNSQKVKELEKEYDVEIRLVVYDMFLQAAEAEGMVRNISEIWKASFDKSLKVDDFAKLFNSSVIAMNKHFGDLPYGSTVVYKGDFNLAIKYLLKYYDTEGKITSLRDKKFEIANKMKELNNPPEKYKKAFDIALELYTLYEKYTDMAISPSGSLVSYTQEVNNLSSEIVSKYKQFEVMLPEIEE